MDIDNTTSDEDLMQAYQGGNYTDFEILYTRHKARILGFLMKRLRNRFEAEEVFQGTFMKLHSSRRHYDPSFRFDPWLFTVCQSVLRDYLRKKKRIAEDSNDEYLDQIPANESLGETASINFSSLDEKQRMALELRYGEDLDFDEVAKKLQTTSGNVRQLVSRAIRKLRKNLNREDT